VYERSDSRPQPEDLFARVQNKLRERRQHLREQIMKATRKDGGAGDETPRRPPEGAA
jgi:hypothetical protein